MKQPQMTDLRIDHQGTERIRAALAQTTTIKITINLTVDSLQRLRQGVNQGDASSQRLLSQLVTEGLTQQSAMEVRLTRLENELKKLKRQLAA